MKSEQKALLDEAIEALKLRDIMLHECAFKRPAPPPEDTEEVKVRQLTKSAVSFVVGEWPEGPTEDALLLQVTVSLGIRVVGMQPHDPPVYFEIEADYVVEYDVRSDLSEEAIKIFANLNSIHNVWPFWRQHVFDIMGRARLPHITVPLFSGKRLQTEADAAPTDSADSEATPAKSSKSAAKSRTKSGRVSRKH